MKKQKVIENLLTRNPLVELEGNRVSTLAITLNSAKFLLGNSFMSNAYQNDVVTEYIYLHNLYELSVFLGGIGYLTFLDQVGKVFIPINRNELQLTGIKGRSAIANALTYFSTLSATEIDVIREFRNSLIHQFGLASNNYLFTMCYEEGERVIKIAETKWDGDYNNKNEENQTIVFVPNFVRLVEGVYDQILNDNKKNSVDLALNIEEIYSRFTIIS